MRKFIWNQAKKFSRNFGIELRKYSIRTSEEALIKHLFAYHNIDFVFDVGANAGQYSQLLRKIAYSGKIISFEPLLDAYKKLEKLAVQDDLWVVAPRSAVGDRNGEITINVSERSTSSSILPMLKAHLEASPDSIYVGSEVVPLVCLDTVAPAYITPDTNAIFLKIDVQGFEKYVLAGATQLLSKVTGLQIELSVVPLYEGQPLLADMLATLSQLGFELHALLPVVIHPTTGRLLQMDGIFFRRE
ncbi:FkbM family methyltransferase [Nostoc sp. CCCryo 231-06]|nr:FkbM family methyltransferase [Nostoc sp. CCCryo 231-06]